MMTNTFYKGEYKNFDFNRYIDIHLEAHRYYDQAEPGALTELMKILHFKSGIRSEAGMETSLEAAQGFPHINASFTVFSNYLTEGLNSKKSRAKIHKGATRNVSGLQYEEGTGLGRGCSGRGGRGRGQGRGCGRGRVLGRVRGRGQYQCHSQSLVVEGKTLYPSKTYSDHDIPSSPIIKRVNF